MGAYSPPVVVNQLAIVNRNCANIFLYFAYLVFTYAHFRRLHAPLSPVFLSMDPAGGFPYPRLPL